MRILCYQEPQNWAYEYGHGCGWDCDLPTAEKMLLYLDTWVEKAAENGFYCIIDYHPVGGHGEEESMEWWGVVAPRYKDRTHVIYELCNEPVAWDPTGYTDRVIYWQEDLFRYVRSLAPDTHIMCWSFANAKEGLFEAVRKGDDISYENASVAFHAYAKSDDEIRLLLKDYPAINSEIGGNSSTEYTEMVNAMEALGVHSWILLDGTGRRKAVEVSWEADPYFAAR